VNIVTQLCVSYERQRVLTTCKVSECFQLGALGHKQIKSTNSLAVDELVAGHKQIKSTNSLAVDERVAGHKQIKSTNSLAVDERVAGDLREVLDLHAEDLLLRHLDAADPGLDRVLVVQHGERQDVVLRVERELEDCVPLRRWG
jgi:hypothetical protein